MQSMLHPIRSVTTTLVAEEKFASDSFYILLGKKLVRDYTLFASLDFTIPDWDPDLSVPLLPLVTYFQYRENLIDSQAAQALRTRLDWQYALSMPEKYPRLPDGVLCQFRNYCKLREETMIEVQVLLENIAADSALKPFFTIPTHAGEIIASVCWLNRFEFIKNALEKALKKLKGQYTEFFLHIAKPGWIEPSELEFAAFHTLDPVEMQLHNFQSIGKDIYYLLECISTTKVPGLDCLPEVQDLYSIWLRHFHISPDSSIQVWPQCRYCANNRHKHL